jgi:hypothetical protein
MPFTAGHANAHTPLWSLHPYCYAVLRARAAARAAARSRGSAPSGAPPARALLWRPLWGWKPTRLWRPNQPPAPPRLPASTAASPLPGACPTPRPAAVTPPTPGSTNMPGPPGCPWRPLRGCSYRAPGLRARVPLSLSPRATRRLPPLAGGTPGVAHAPSPTNPTTVSCQSLCRSPPHVRVVPPRSSSRAAPAGLRAPPPRRPCCGVDARGAAGAATNPVTCAPQRGCVRPTRLRQAMCAALARA